MKLHLLMAIWILCSTVAVHAEEVTVRVATFNIEELSWEKLEQVDADGKGTHPQLVAAASIIQQVRPDVLLLNEIDYTGADDTEEVSANRNAVAAFLKRYLEHPQQGSAAITFPYSFYRATNTGVPAGHDFNNDGQTTGPEDAWGFGRYPGQYGMALISRFPIDAEKARTFRKLLWKKMPGRTMPDGQDGRPAFYSEEEQAVFRLSSKSHWDVPVQIAGKSIHLLCSHPTPPIFDGPEDANGRRNFDELRFWSDYLTGGESAAWIHDDNDQAGGLPPSESFVILGDLNADPVRCETTYGRTPISWVLSHPRVFDPQPQSAGALESENPGKLSGFLPYKTNRFGRLDYVLPSRDLILAGCGVHWPTAARPAAEESQIASDHRLVWLDLRFLMP
jgi:hypothetical protein